MEDDNKEDKYEMKMLGKESDVCSDGGEDNYLSKNEKEKGEDVQSAFLWLWEVKRKMYRKINTKKVFCRSLPLCSYSILVYHLVLMCQLSFVLLMGFVFLCVCRVLVCCVVLVRWCVPHITARFGLSVNQLVYSLMYNLL
jgi:hypothetical protein